MPIPNNETRFFQLQIRTDSVTGPVQITSNVVTVVDSQQAFIQATGGFVTLEDGYKTHHFASSNTFQVLGLGIPANRSIEYFAVAGGGGGGSVSGNDGGGGAGGIQEGNVTLSSTGNYVVMVGSGGAANQNGSNSNISLSGSLSIVAFGGGSGGRSGFAANIGGSGGGGKNAGGAGALGWSGQGYPGGSGHPTSPYGAGGGGGAGQAGLAGLAYFGGGDQWNPSAQGGNGISRSWIFPSYGVPSLRGSLHLVNDTVTKDRWFGGGGAGGSDAGNPTAGSNQSIGWGGMGGGGGTSVTGPSTPRILYYSVNGVATSGGGGAGKTASNPTAAGTGGSGLVAIRYPYTVETYNDDDNIGVSQATVDNSNVVYTLTTVNVSNATVLYWTLSGNVSNNDVLGGNTGSFTLINANATFTVRLANNIVSGTNTKVYTPQLRKNSLTGPVVSTGNTLVIYSSSNRNNFINATGGNVITSGGFRTHVLTASNSFVVSSAGALGGVVDYVIVAGGGGAPSGGAPTGIGGGGGGAGGMLTGTYVLSAQTYLANVGAGGSGGGPAWNLPGSNGGNSDIFGILTVGGGAGGVYTQSNGQYASAGGSGGGAFGGVNSGSTNYGGNSYIGQGNPGGSISGSNPSGGTSAGGGGAGAAAGNFGAFSNGPRVGGSGRPISWVPGFYGTPGPTSGRWFAGGGGGSTNQNTGEPGAGGAGGGGRGVMSGPQNLPAFSGNVSTGGGGGGGSGPSYPAGAGGSGIIIIRYPYV